RSTTLFAVALITTLWLASFGGGNVQAQSQSCASCSQGRYDCWVKAEWAFLKCISGPNIVAACEDARNTAEQACENTYYNCSSICDPGGVNRKPTFQTGCTDNGIGGLTSLDYHGYVNGWAMDGDASTYNDKIQIYFYVDQPYDAGNPQ